MPAAGTFHDLRPERQSLQTDLKHSHYHPDLRYTSQVLYSASAILSLCVIVQANIACHEQHISADPVDLYAVHRELHSSARITPGMWA